MTRLGGIPDMRTTCWFSRHVIRGRSDDCPSAALVSNTHNSSGGDVGKDVLKIGLTITYPSLCPLVMCLIISLEAAA